MKKTILPLAIMLLIASVTFAAGVQGEIVKIKGNEIVIAIFDDQKTGFNAGDHVSLESIPPGVSNRPFQTT